ncbi:MAG: zinc ribbon domain-containing protein [Bacilli bacterium]
MSLIKCKECGKEISDSAKSCPECGFVYKKEHSTIKTIIICICTIVVIFLVLLIIVLFPEISDSIKEKNAVNKIVGEYEIVNTSNESIVKKISITKDNTLYICNQGYMPSEIKDGYYYIYEEDNKQYVITTSKTLGNDSNEYILLLYDNGELISQFKEVLSIKCRYGSSEGGKTSNIQLKYQK